MKERELRRSIAVFSIGAVMRLTDLSARQIRYYEEQGLIKPERTQGNRRLFSLNDMDRLLEIKDFISDGYTIAAIKQEYVKRQKKLAAKGKALSDAEVRQILREELRNQGGFSTPAQTLGNFRI
ncbi:MerR family transcriptional regulator [Streptococcus halichoeri]|uniref:MerR family transcriptional regulator n=1 Tax=Streptococcus halichoeri TaxID=254785 RepID=UPI00135840FA|nr:MerR family transcriptional regulator [Streptococcus halichoeri]